MSEIVQSGSQQRMVIPRELEPPVDSTTDAVRSGAGGRLEPSLDRVADILSKAIDIVTARKGRAWHYDGIRAMKAALEKAISTRCTRILKAAEITPAKIRLAANWEQQRKDERNKLAKELRTASNRLKGLKYNIRNAEKHLTVLSGVHADENGYPKVPPPSVTFSRYGDGIPAVSGIYFAWNNGVVVYVGQSVNLKSRAKFGHHAIESDDLLSWVEIPKNRLNFAESFYIGVLMPRRNFGARSCYASSDGIDSDAFSVGGAEPVGEQLDAFEHGGAQRYTDEAHRDDEAKPST